MPDVTGGAAIAGGLGGLIGGVGSLFGGGGGGGSDAYLQAAGLSYAANQDAIRWQQQMLDQARGYMQPWVSAGGNALKQYGGLLNLPGYKSVDPTATLRATPGYNWLMGQGVEARDRSAAARGMLGSGAQQKGLTAWGQGLADQTYNNYLNRLQGLESQGQSAAALQGSYGMQSAPAIGNYLTQGAQAQGMGMVGADMARQSAYGSGMNNLFGGLGMLGYGLGQSGIGNALSNWWGGGGTMTPSFTSSDYYPGGYGYQDWAYQ